MREGDAGMANIWIQEMRITERFATAEGEDRAVFRNTEDLFTDHDPIMFAGSNVAIGQNGFAADREDFLGMSDFGVEEEVVIIGGLNAAASADGGVAGFADEEVRAAEHKREKNAEGGEKDQGTEKQERSVSVRFHTVEERAKRERKQAESAATKLNELRGADRQA